MPRRTAGAVTSGADTTTSAGLGVPGNARSTARYAFTTGRLFGNESKPAFAVCMWNAGSATTTRPAAATSAAARGKRSAGRSTRFHTRDSPLPRLRRRSEPQSTRSPRRPRSAGSTVSDPTIAMSTTRIAPKPIETKSPEPESVMPAQATATVRPETSTARPEVAAAACSASRGSRPRARSSRSRRR